MGVPWHTRHTQGRQACGGCNVGWIKPGTVLPNGAFHKTLVSSWYLFLPFEFFSCLTFKSRIRLNKKAVRLNSICGAIESSSRGAKKRDAFWYAMVFDLKGCVLFPNRCSAIDEILTLTMISYAGPTIYPRTTGTQWRHKSKIPEKLDRCCGQNMLRPYLFGSGSDFLVVQWWRLFPLWASVLLQAIPK